MASLIGIVRLILTVLLIGSGLVPTLLLALVPRRYRGARLSAWYPTLMARVFIRIFGIRFTCRHPERLANHHGLLFPNHTSYLDIVALILVAPVRFLAAAEVRRQPVIGWYAAAAETVFVNRSSKQSRRSARHSLASVLQSDPFPPIAVFPEGRLGPGTHLMPFRHGAFELAVQNQVPYLPVAIHYDRPDVVTWHGGSRNETMVAAVWRLACRRGSIALELRPLEPLRPSAADDPALLAVVTQRAIEQALGFPPGPTDLDEAPPAKFERIQTF
jgi:1-acyl-sn-glycerol-3-phosphate acyltransferase